MNKLNLLSAQNTPDSGTFVRRLFTRTIVVSRLIQEQRFILRAALKDGHIEYVHVEYGHIELNAKRSLHPAAQCAVHTTRRVLLWRLGECARHEWCLTDTWSS